MKKWVHVKVPASTSNLGPGFDVLGLALKLYNEIELRVEPVRRSRSAGVHVEVQGEGESSLPRDARNLVWKAASNIFKKLRVDLSHFNVHLKCVNRIPLARGLGSSAASALGGMLAANAIAGNRLSKVEVLQLAVALEGHPDNVVPCLFGGLCISGHDGEQVDYLRVDMPKNLSAVVCIPEFELSTKKAREALPKKVFHKDAVFNISKISFFLGAIFTRNYRFLKNAMQDKLHQNYRKKLIPGFDWVVEKGRRAGALGVALSGAGPSMFAFAPASKASRVGNEMSKGFLKSGIRSRSIRLDFDRNGAQIRH